MSPDDRTRAPQNDSGKPDTTDLHAQARDGDFAATTYRVLAGARGLIGDGSGWTFGAMARDRHGRPVGLSSERAVRFCLSGALLRAADDEGLAEPSEVYAGVQGGDEPRRLGATRVAFAMLAAASIFEARRSSLLAADKGEKRRPSNASPTALLSVAARLLQMDAQLPGFESSRVSVLMRLVWDMNDLSPKSRTRALSALDRAFDAAAALLHLTAGADESGTGGEAGKADDVR